MIPVIIKIGPVTIYSFGVLMALAFLAGGWILKRELERRCFEAPSELASSMVFWAAIGGLGGARVLFILENWTEFLGNPLSFIFSGAGFVWYGGLIGGLLSVSLFVRAKGIPWLIAADCAAPALAVAYAVGRIGCHVAGDGDWGTITTAPWGVAYTNAVVGWNYPPGVNVHPTPLYEMAESLLIFGFLQAWSKKKLAPGRLFWMYLALASLARFGVEFWRINPKVLAGLTEAQLFAVALFLVGGYLYLNPPRFAASSPLIAGREKKR
jgi:phosphatidylglycerol:prolipoprotein diacylglycerol transferase